MFGQKGYSLNLSIRQMRQINCKARDVGVAIPVSAKYCASMLA